jgi:hypothetical protein
MEHEQRISALIADNKSSLLRVAVKITIYYAALAVVLVVLAATTPSFIDQLPLGGVGEISDIGSSSIYDLEEALLSADDEEIEDIVTESTRARLARGPAWLQEAMSLIYAMTSTLILMLPVSWAYRAIHKGSVYDHSIDTTTLVLPAVVAGIVTVVQHSLALAFSLAGIAAGVRFRRALSDTFDTLFILYASIGVCTFGDGLESQHVAHEKIRRKSDKAARAREKAARDDPHGPMSNL